MFDDYPLDELVPLIDWTPFFNTWELAGRYPAILKDEVVGVQARELFADAQAMLKRIIELYESADADKIKSLASLDDRVDRASDRAVAADRALDHDLASPHARGRWRGGFGPLEQGQFAGCKADTDAQPRTTQESAAVHCGQGLRQAATQAVHRGHVATAHMHQQLADHRLRRR